MFSVPDHIGHLPADHRFTDRDGYFTYRFHGHPYPYLWIQRIVTEPLLINIC